MTDSLVRARYVIIRTTGHTGFDMLEDAGIVIRDGTIRQTGDFKALHAQHPQLPIIGDGTQLLVPGFVNAHHHIGLTPFQLGAHDMPLELWGITRVRQRPVDDYLDTLYSAFEMIASGVTTVQHIHGWLAGSMKEIEARNEAVIRAYDDIGMRLSYCYGVRDQNHIMYCSDQDMIGRMPDELKPMMQAWVDAIEVRLEGGIDIFKDFYARHNHKRRVKVQMAPANLHWCSDDALELLADTAHAYDVPLHMHLVETPFQKQYARLRGGTTAFDYIKRFHLHGPRLTLGHGTWLSEQDVIDIAESGTCVCHNCSSNMRLRSGRAPLNLLEKHGVTTAIGIDEAGINEDRDMLLEMKLVLNSHRDPGLRETDVPGVGQVMRMATVGGAATTPWRGRIGTIEVGMAADMSLIDYKAMTYPYQDSMVSLLDAFVYRSKAKHVSTVICDGEVIYADGRFTRIDREAVLAEIHDRMARSLTPAEESRRTMSAMMDGPFRDYYEHFPGWNSARQRFEGDGW